MLEDRTTTAPDTVVVGLLARLALLALLAAGLHVAGCCPTGHAWWPVGSPVDGETSSAVWLALALVYILAMALPFVPGIEIGFALMLWLGTKGIVLVYVCTQIALGLSFCCGRRVPPTEFARLLRTLGLLRASRWLEGIDASSAACRVGAMAPHGLPRLWRGARAYRYLTLAVALNLPGNAVIGGAGGLGWIAGASRLFSAPGYLLTMAIATTPVPLALLLGGAAAVPVTGG